MQRAIDLYIGQEKSVAQVARILETSVKTVYRYLIAGKVNLREKKRNNRGQIISA